jgi:hypothetical protein
VFSLTQTLLIGAALLVIAASVPAPRKPGVVWVWLACLVMLGLGSLAVHSYVQWSGFAPNSRPSERAKFVRQNLRRVKAKNVLWFDGGSYVNNAVSSSVIESELKKLGYDVSVMNLGMGASNHFERQALYRRLAPLLDEHRKQQKKQRWVYLAEVQKHYDEFPLSQLNKNLETARSYDYMTPQVVWDAFWALGTEGTRQPPSAWSLRLEALRHGLVYAFNAGITSRLVSSREIRAQAGGTKRITPRRFRYPGLASVMAEANRPPVVAIPPWVFDVRERREHEIWDKYVQRWVYFATPSTRASYQAYAASFCGATDRPCIPPNDISLLARLDSRDKWYDEGHLSAGGAKIYSKWLARKLHESGALAR